MHLSLRGRHNCSRESNVFATLAEKSMGTSQAITPIPPVTQAILQKLFTLQKPIPTENSDCSNLLLATYRHNEPIGASSKIFVY